MKKSIPSSIIRIVITIVFLFLSFYIMLPPINPRSTDFWNFIIFAIIVIFVINFFSVLSEFLKSLGIRTEKDIVIHPASKKLSIGKSLKFTFISVGVILLLMIIGTFIGSPIFNASRYKKLLTINDGDFTQDVAELNMSQIPVVDKDTATRLGRRKLGEMSDLVSQFEINPQFTQINYQGTPTRVTPLTYGDPIKWLYNQKNGLPAYLLVDLVTQETSLIRLEQGMRYSPSEYFFRNINRHLRFHYPTKIFDTVSFEIDDNGTPYWVAPTVSYRIGFWSGKDISGAVLVNAITGDSAYYDVENVPTWVDQVYTSDLVVEQLTYNGKYQSGFFNSIFGQRGVMQPTAGYNYIAIGDDVYLYTGMTSVMSDQSNVGFVLINLRTKATNFYPVPGAEEFSAMGSAEGQVQHLNYNSTFPLLLNVSDRPTYFMSLKDDAGLVKMYAFVDVQQYQIVGTGVTVDEARANYISTLRAEGSVMQQEKKDSQTITATITAMQSGVVDGNTCYYFMLDNQADMVYTAWISVSQMLPFYQIGDQVEITYTEIGNVREIRTIKRLQSTPETTAPEATAPVPSSEPASE